MIAILTSSLGGSVKENGKRIPAPLLKQNGLTDVIKKHWKENSKVLMICAGSEDYARNDSILYCQREAFKISGLSAVSFEMCDYRNEMLVNQIKKYDVVILVGGHVPTQNAFFERIDLKNKLNGFSGLLLSWSAGSMNCAEMVYAMPELEGEGVDTEYHRFIPGLGITKTMIIPHFQSVKEDMVDGLRAIEDIAYSDSIGNTFIALNDGSFIVCMDGTEKLYGEAFSIRDGVMRQICKDGSCVKL